MKRKNIEQNITLGIWDGHDSGAAFLRGSEILFAANEERFTRRKLEVGFPLNSIKRGLKYLEIDPGEIQIAAYSTSDPAKTLTRLIPGLKEKYYLIRRKKIYPGSFTNFQKRFKYFFTELSPNLLSRAISDFIIKKNLKNVGIDPETLVNVDHHTAHAYGAYMSSKFKKCLVITLDGIGDGLSGSVWEADGKELNLVHKQSGRHSLGIFFEHVTNLLNMRELEDEGKAMALADYSIPIKKEENPLMSFFTFQKGELRAKYSSNCMYKELKRILWKYPFERFAYLAQKTLEYYALKFVRFWLKKTGYNKIVFAGGVAANIKLNHKIMSLNEVTDMFIFPHMGDGGLALGAVAFYVYKHQGIRKVKFRDCFLGPEFPEDQIREEIERYKVNLREVDPVKTGASLVAKGNIVLWYQGNMEFGPRALGHRSILALPGSESIKDDLNLKIKKRVWYQPFCPSMLLADAKKLFTELKGTPNEFMTMGYFVKYKKRKDLNGVINIDGSCRPQIVLSHNKVYHELIREVKKRTGLGVILNTSFNLHGYPIVNSPSDALEVLVESDVDCLIMNNYLITKK
ncbi:hypothetical protein JW766_06295 [Candidatus Dojkabacteria bacterium]|nr:hypothetical protein [Candidatus Dojkabacteria bacterium]